MADLGSTDEHETAASSNWRRVLVVGGCLIVVAAAGLAAVGRWELAFSVLSSLLWVPLTLGLALLLLGFVILWPVAPIFFVREVFEGWPHGWSDLRQIVQAPLNDWPDTMQRAAWSFVGNWVKCSGGLLLYGGLSQGWCFLVVWLVGRVSSLLGVGQAFATWVNAEIAPVLLDAEPLPFFSEPAIVAYCVVGFLWGLKETRRVSARSRTCHSCDEPVTPQHCAAGVAWAQYTSDSGEHWTEHTGGEWKAYLAPNSRATKVAHLWCAQNDLADDLSVLDTRFANKEEAWLYLRFRTFGGFSNVFAIPFLGVGDEHHAAKIDELKARAEEGDDAGAQHLLGGCYLHGDYGCQGRSKFGPLRRSKSRPVGEGVAVFVGRLERSLRSPFRAAQA